ncbi:hypothetical protein GJ744_001344 [Endocarpon pusillum]|uniref:Uncharacterized protein n=1 Tax=Endocarpon pusillum TaxID=364733 RepID=A0A8H7E6N5_9EURO|nr:hypothetical protein GJ744_001344 [Endocarpon pusillum]
MSFDTSDALLVDKLPVALLENIPGLSPPPGQISNFVDPPNLVKAVAIVVTITTLLILPAVGLRIYSNIR